MRERLYSVSLGSPPRIAMLTAGYKGLFSGFCINKVNVVVVNVVRSSNKINLSLQLKVLHIK